MAKENIKVKLGKKKLTRYGSHSLGVVIPIWVVKAIGLKPGDEVEVEWNNADEITIRMPKKE